MFLDIDKEKNKAGKRDGKLGIGVGEFVAGRGVARKRAVRWNLSKGGGVRELGCETSRRREF